MKSVPKRVSTRLATIWRWPSSAREYSPYGYGVQVGLCEYGLTVHGKPGGLLASVPARLFRLKQVLISPFSVPCVQRSRQVIHIPDHEAQAFGPVTRVSLRLNVGERLKASAKARAFGAGDLAARSCPAHDAPPAERIHLLEYGAGGNEMAADAADAITSAGVLAIDTLRGTVLRTRYTRGT